MLQREAAGSGDVLQPKQESNVGVSNRDALKVVVVASHEVEEILAAVAIEDHFAIARALDDDGLLWRAALSQIICAVEGRAIGGRVAIEAAVHKAAIFVNARVNQDDVSGLNARRQGV